VKVNQGGEEYGVERLEDVIAVNAKAALPELARKILAAVGGVWKKVQKIRRFCCRANCDAATCILIAFHFMIGKEGMRVGAGNGYCDAGTAIWGAG
jgi:hypothetical protein